MSLRLSLGCALIERASRVSCYGLEIPLVELATDEIPPMVRLHVAPACAANGCPQRRVVEQLAHLLREFTRVAGNQELVPRLSRKTLRARARADHGDAHCHGLEDLVLNPNFYRHR